MAKQMAKRVEMTKRKIHKSFKENEKMKLLIKESSIFSIFLSPCQPLNPSGNSKTIKRSRKLLISICQKTAQP